MHRAEVVQEKQMPIFGKKLGQEEVMPFKKYSPKQKKLARVAKPRNKITSTDFVKLQSKKKSAKSVSKKVKVRRKK